MTKIGYYNEMFDGNYSKLCTGVIAKTEIYKFSSYIIIILQCKNRRKIYSVLNSYANKIKRFTVET